MTLTLELAAIVVGALVLAALVPRVPTRPRSRRARRSASRPATLERVERVVEAGHQTAGDVHTRVRPLLREIAAPLLRRQGVDLDSEPQRARTLLGDELWEIVRHDRSRPRERRDPGLSFRDLERLVQRLERL
jgi:hypothetical protein